MKKTDTNTQGRVRRHARVRAKVVGSAERPRLSVYKSNRYVHAQIIDDASGTTVVSGSTKEAKAEKKMDASKWLGSEIAKRAKGKGIDKVVFDRGGFRYTGRIAAVAEGARQGGLEF